MYPNTEQPEDRSINRGAVLADYIERKSYGDIINFQVIQDLLREKKGTSRYYAGISKAKKLLEERGKMIKPIGHGEYQVLYPGDYISAYAGEIRRANNRVKHGGKILEHAPSKDMTQTEYSAYQRVKDFHVAMGARMAGGVVEVKKLVERPHPFDPANVGKP